AAHRKRVPAVADLDEEQGVRAHERRGHGDLRAVGEAKILVRPEFLEAAEEVVPAPDIEPRRMLAQLVQALVHFERGEYRFDEHRRLDRALRDSQLTLGSDEDIVPQARLEMALQLGQIKVGPAAAREQRLRVVKEIQGEIEYRTRDGAAVHQDVPFDQVPAARAHEQCGGLFVEPVALALRTVVLDGAIDGIAQIDLTFDHVLPTRRVRVFEISHEHVCAAVERVDHHLAVGRARDFDAAVLQITRRGSRGPVGFPDGFRRGQKIGQLAGSELDLTLVAERHQLPSSPLELARKLCGEGESLWREYVGVAGQSRAANLNAGKGG